MPFDNYNPIIVPPEGWVVDEGHPLGVGMAGMWLPYQKNPPDLTANGNNGTTNGNVVAYQGFSGPMGSFQASGQYINIGSPPDLELYTNVTISTHISAWDQTESNGVAVVGKDYSSGSRGFLIGTDAYTPYLEVGGSGLISAGSNIIGQPGLFHLAATCSGGTSWTLYQNGKSIGTATAGALTPNSSAAWQIAQRSYSGFPSAFSGYIQNVQIYSYTMPAALMAWLAREPFAMLQPVVRRQYFVGSSSGGTTVNPSSGSIVLTGHAPTIAAGTTLHPVAGAVTLSGHVPTIAAAGNTTLNPAAGSVAITGHVPTIAAGLKLTPAAGSIVFTGHVPTVTPGTAAITLNPMSGSIVFQGQVPQIYAGVPFKGGGSGDGDKARQRWLDWLDKKARSRFEAKKASASVGKVAPSVPKVVPPEVAPASLSGEMTAVAPPFYAAEIRVDLLEAAIDAEVSAALSEDDDMAIILMLAHD